MAKGSTLLGMQSCFRGKPFKLQSLTINPLPPENSHKVPQPAYMRFLVMGCSLPVMRLRRTPHGVSCLLGASSFRPGRCEKPTWSVPPWYIGMRGVCSRTTAAMRDNEYTPPYHPRWFCVYLPPSPLRNQTLHISDR